MLNKSQKRYLVRLKQQLCNLERTGNSNTPEWWSIAESIDALENNL